MNNFYDYNNYISYTNGYPINDNPYIQNNFNDRQNIIESKEENNIYTPYEGFIRGNMFTNLYDPYKTNRPYEIRPMNRQAEMLTNIDALTFAMIDINLYLDVHPKNKKLIKEFNKIQKQKHELLMEYEREFGPLLVTNSRNDNYWAWVENPWPWESR